MIDVENQIITDVINGFTGTDYANIKIASDPPQKAVFPYVLFYQSDAYPTRGTHIASREDTFETVVFTADIYSNKANNAKTECKKIQSIIDDTMQGLGFSRFSSSPIFKMPELAKARRLVRYRANVSKQTYTDGNRTRNIIYNI